LKELKASGNFKFVVLNFHEYLDALIGIRDLKKLKFNINLQNNLLTRSYGNNFKLYYNKPSKIKIKPRTRQLHCISYTKPDSDLFIPTKNINDVEIQEGLYKIHDGNINIVVENPTSIEQEIEIDDLGEELIEPEEIKPFCFQQDKGLKNLNNLIRMDHMNSKTTNDYQNLQKAH